MGRTVAHSLLTRMLHSALALAVLWQLLGSGLVERPKNGHPGNLFFEIHQAVGLTTLALVTAFWIWALWRRSETPAAALFPWLDPTRRAAVRDDLQIHWQHLRRWRLPDTEEDTPLASAIHGLGLLAALAMGASGGYLFMQDEPGGIVLEAHAVLSNFLWAYVVAHAGIAVLHQAFGHGVLQRMFAAQSRAPGRQ